MTTNTSDLNLLMVHADDHAPVLADGLAESTARGQQGGGGARGAGRLRGGGGGADHRRARAAGAGGGGAGGGGADEAGHFGDEGGDPNDIELQRWGVIAPQGPEGDRLLALIRPLIEHRQAQQGDTVRVYRVPQRLTQDEAMRWKKREFDSGA